MDVDNRDPVSDTHESTDQSHTTAHADHIDPLFAEEEIPNEEADEGLLISIQLHTGFLIPELDNTHPPDLLDGSDSETESPPPLRRSTRGRHAPRPYWELPKPQDVNDMDDDEVIYHVHRIFRDSAVDDSSRSDAMLQMPTGRAETSDSTYSMADPLDPSDMKEDMTFQEVLFQANIIKVLDKMLPVVKPIIALQSRIKEYDDINKPYPRQLRRQLDRTLHQFEEKYGSLLSTLEQSRVRINKARAPNLQFDWTKAANSSTPADADKVNIMDAPPKPKGINDMLTHRFMPYFLKAMQVEYESLIGHKIWEPVTKQDIPGNRRPIRSKWIFDYKTDPLGYIERFKARLVAVGTSQIEGIDYDQTHSSVVKIKVVRIFIALSALLGFHLRTADVVTAYLYGDLETANYMEMPRGFEQTHPDGRPLFCKLVKSLYGLHQSGREWFKKLKNGLTDLGFTQLKSEPCAFIRFDPVSNQLTVLLTYVDDIMIASGNREQTEAIKEELKTKFALREGSEDANWILKIRIEKLDTGTWLGQPAYIEKLLRKQDLWDLPISKQFRTPMSVTYKHDRLSPLLNADDTTRYASLIAQYLYLAMTTRPDILYATNTLAQFQREPHSSDMEAALRIAGYLRFTHDHGLFYARDSDPKAETIVFESESSSSPIIQIPTNFPIEGFADASYGQEVDRKSRAAYMIMLGGCLVAWYSKNINQTVLSSTEAEINALVEGIKETIWFRDFLRELGAVAQPPTVLHQDNQSVIAIAQNPIHHARVKHFELKTHFIHENVEGSIIKLVYCPTKLMLADILTKALAAVDHWRIMDLMGMRSLSKLETSTRANHIRKINIAYH